METVTPDAPVLQSQTPRSPLVPILALITILSLSASAFLYYQSLGLQKQLSELSRTTDRNSAIESKEYSETPTNPNTPNVIVKDKKLYLQLSTANNQLIPFREDVTLHLPITDEEISWSPTRKSLLIHNLSYDHTLGGPSPAGIYHITSSGKIEQVLKSSGRTSGIWSNSDTCLVSYTSKNSTYFAVISLLENNGKTVKKETLFAQTEPSTNDNIIVISDNESVLVPIGLSPDNKFAVFARGYEGERRLIVFDLKDKRVGSGSSWYYIFPQILDQTNWNNTTLTFQGCIMEKEYGSSGNACRENPDKAPGQSFVDEKTDQKLTVKISDILKILNQ